MKNGIVKWLIALNVLVLCGLLVFLVQKHKHQVNLREAQRSEAMAVVREVQKRDTSSQSDKDHLQQIADDVAEKKPLTDDKLQFLLTEMNKPSPQGIATLSSMTAILTIESIETPLSSDQKTILYKCLTPVLAVPDATAGSGISLTQMQKLNACDVLAMYDIRAAVPQIVPLLDDSKPQIRSEAKQALKKLGYNV